MTLSPEQISPLVRPRTLDLSGFRHLEPSSTVVQWSARVAAHGPDMGWRGVQSQPILSTGRREANWSWQRRRKKLRLILRADPESC